MRTPCIAVGLALLALVSCERNTAEIALGFVDQNALKIGK